MFCSCVACTANCWAQADVNSFGNTVAELSDAPLGSAESYLTPNAVVSFQRSPSFLAISSHTNLDPLPDKAFVVYTLFRLYQLPAKNTRYLIAAKFDGTVEPFPGWGIGLMQYSTSLRPELYWRGKDGVGGWYAFGDVELVRGELYSLCMIAEPGRGLRLYLRHYLDGKSGVDGQDGSWANVGLISGANRIGGYILPMLPAIRTEADLIVGSTQQKGRGVFIGEVFQLIVSQISRVEDGVDGHGRRPGKIQRQEEAFWSDLRLSDLVGAKIGSVSGREHGNWHVDMSRIDTSLVIANPASAALSRDLNIVFKGGAKWRKLR